MQVAYADVMQVLPESEANLEILYEAYIIDAFIPMYIFMRKVSRYIFLIGRYIDDE